MSFGVKLPGVGESNQSKRVAEQNIARRVIRQLMRYVLQICVCLIIDLCNFECVLVDVVWLAQGRQRCVPSYSNRGTVARASGSVFETYISLPGGLWPLRFPDETFAASLWSPERMYTDETPTTISLSGLREWQRQFCRHTIVSAKATI